jgi:hypothetical protein
MTNVNELAAHTTVACLASLAGGKMRRFQLNDAPVADTLDEIVPHLVELADSSDCIECRAKTSRGLLRIHATPLKKANVWRHRLNVDLIEGRRDGFIPRALIVQNGAEKSLLIRATPYTVNLPIAAVRAWFRSYLIHGMSLQGSPPDAEEVASGISWVLTVMGMGYGIEFRVPN